MSAETRPRLRLEYLPAAEIDDHPGNWRLHPPVQMQALDSLMSKVGWAGALLFNERTGRLLDGHARKQWVLSRHPGADVPVLIGDWSEEEESAINALLDPVGDLAEHDPEAHANMLSAALMGTMSNLEEALMPAVEIVRWASTVAPISSLKPHPRNYQEHPPDQIDHLVRSIKENGFYRAVVVANDNTILAGHGAVEAGKQAGLVMVPVKRMSFGPDDLRAIKIIAADNEIGNLSLKDERGLTEMLKEVLAEVGDLEGTGFDEMGLAARTFLTRGRREIDSFDAAAEWAGMDMMDYEYAEPEHNLNIVFTSEEERANFVERNDVEIVRKTDRKGQSQLGSIWSGRWPAPAQGRDDLTAIAWKFASSSSENESSDEEE